MMRAALESTKIGHFADGAHSISGGILADDATRATEEGRTRGVVLSTVCTPLSRERLRFDRLATPRTREIRPRVSSRYMLMREMFGIPIPAHMSRSFTSRECGASPVLATIRGVLDELT